MGYTRGRFWVFGARTTVSTRVLWAFKFAASVSFDARCLSCYFLFFLVLFLRPLLDTLQRPTEAAIYHPFS